jgi:hypothetical protein
MALFLPITLAEDDTDFGPAGTQVRIFMEFVIAIGEDSSGNTVFYLNRPGAAGITTVKATQPIDHWKSVTFNP